jgi:hypothetical protein
MTNGRGEKARTMLVVDEYSVAERSVTTTAHHRNNATKRTVRWRRVVIVLSFWFVFLAGRCCRIHRTGVDDGHRIKNRSGFAKAKINPLA